MSVSSENGQGSGKGMGDDSCFLFNLTLNLRFKARPGNQNYQFATEKEARFGKTDLVLKDNFKTCTSKIIVPSFQNAGKKGDTQGSHFCFGNDLT